MLIELLHADLLAMPSDLPYLAGNRSQLLGKLFKSDYLRNTVRWELPHNPAQHSCGARHLPVRNRSGCILSTGDFGEI